MNSHTVPRRLLEQFAYTDPNTNSLRLWRYEKGRTPYPDARPKSSTAVEGHFAHPADAAREKEVETRLAYDFENPVNGFLPRLGDPLFSLNDLQRRQLTFYVTLLFNRTEARRNATGHLHQVTEHAVKKFVSNEIQLLTVAAKWNIDLLLSGRIRNTLITSDRVADMAKELLNNYNTPRHRQQSYVATIERAMANLDEVLYDGQWNFVTTTPSEPFIISDAPVVTWERLERGVISYGLGFHRDNVEVFLPLSPTVCLHLLPDVPRTRAVMPPTATEINTAQASFMGRRCFANIRSSVIDNIVQANFGRAVLGISAFTVWHRNYETSVYDILMNGGRWVEPPRLRGRLAGS